MFILTFDRKEVVRGRALWVSIRKAGVKWISPSHVSNLLKLNEAAALSFGSGPPSTNHQDVVWYTYAKPKFFYAHVWFVFLLPQNMTNLTALKWNDTFINLAFKTQFSNLKMRPHIIESLRKRLKGRFVWNRTKWKDAKKLLIGSQGIWGHALSICTLTDYHQAVRPYA